MIRLVPKKLENLPDDLLEWRGMEAKYFPQGKKSAGGIPNNLACHPYQGKE